MRFAPGSFLGSVAATAAVTAGAMYVLSRVGGWGALAERYPLRGAFPRPKTRLGYGVFRGWIGYNGGLIVASDAAGLYLRVWPIIALGHPPVFIPWSEVLRVEPPSGLFGSYRLVTRQAPDVDFGLRDRTFALVRPDAERAGVRLGVG